MKTAIGSILLIVGLITTVFFENYAGDIIPYPLLGYFIGFAGIGIGFLLIKSGLEEEDTEEEQEQLHELETFKQQSQKVKIDLTACEINHHAYQEEQEKIRHFDAVMWDGLYAPEKNVEIVSVHQVIITTQVLWKNETLTLRSPVIYRDQLSVKILLDQHKETYVYIDPNNAQRYYMDVEFLR